MNDLKSTNYNDFLQKTIEKIDVYGVGLSLSYVLQYFEGYMPEEIATRMRWLFKFAIHPNVFLRLTPEQLLSKYDEIMNKWPVEKSSSEVSEKSVLPNTLSSSKKSSSHALSAVAEIELELPAPVLAPVSKECPPNKEWNPKTRRCNKKCGPKSHRNEQFKCVRNSTTKRKK